MADVQIKITGLAELDRALERFPQELQRKALADAWRKAGRIMAADAKDRAPVRVATEGGFGKASGKSIRAPGFLKSSIRLVVKNVNGIPTAFIGWGKAAFYGAFQEFGTSRQAAKPFMRPAFDSSVQEVIREFAFQLRLGVERTAKKFYAKGK